MKNVATSTIKKTIQAMVYGNVLGKYVLKKEVTDYLPKSDNGEDTITEKKVD